MCRKIILFNAIFCLVIRNKWQYIIKSLSVVMTNTFMVLKHKNIYASKFFLFILNSRLSIIWAFRNCFHGFSLPKSIAQKNT